MSLFEWIQSLVLTGSLVVIAVQSWLMRRAVGEQQNQLLVQSCLQVWQAHIQSCHLPVVTADDEIARELLKMTPYNQLELADARKAMFADAVLDTYECITLMAKLGVLKSEIARVWIDSIPYEFENPNLRKHWLAHHQEKQDSAPSQGIYLQGFAELIRQVMRNHPLSNEALNESRPTKMENREQKGG